MLALMVTGVLLTVALLLEARQEGKLSCRRCMAGRCSACEHATWSTR